MPVFGVSSREHLNTCNISLVAVFEEVVSQFDCKVLCGARMKGEQDRAFAKGLSHVQWPNSEHNVRPDPEPDCGLPGWGLPQRSHAIDVAPYPIDWEDTIRFYHFAGYVLGVAWRMDVQLRWGGDWDGDRKLRDQKFFDLVHFELEF